MKLCFYIKNKNKLEWLYLQRMKCTQFFLLIPFHFVVKCIIVTCAKLNHHVTFLKSVIKQYCGIVLLLNNNQIYYVILNCATIF